MDYPKRLFDFDICERDYYNQALQEYREKEPKSADQIEFVQDFDNQTVYEVWLKGEARNFALFLEIVNRIMNEHEVQKYTINEQNDHLFVALTNGYDNNFIVQNGKRVYSTVEEAYAVITKIQDLQSLVKEIVLAEEKNDLSTMLEKLRKLSDTFGMAIITAQQLNKKMVDFAKGNKEG